MEWNRKLLKAQFNKTPHAYNTFNLIAVLLTGYLKFYFKGCAISEVTTHLMAMHSSQLYGV